MTRINRKDLSVRMVTAEDVHDRNGRLLLNTETELTEKHLRVFKLWGIIDVAIHQLVDKEGNRGEDEIVGSIHNPLLEKEKEKMKSLFRYTNPEHPFIKSLFQLAVDKKVRSISMEDSFVK